MELQSDLSNCSIWFHLGNKNIVHIRCIFWKTTTRLLLNQTEIWLKQCNYFLQMSSFGMKDSKKWQEKGRTIFDTCLRGSFSSSDQELLPQQCQFYGFWVPHNWHPLSKATEIVLFAQKLLLEKGWNTL